MGEHSKMTAKKKIKALQDSMTGFKLELLKEKFTKESMKLILPLTSNIIYQLIQFRATSTLYFKSHLHICGCFLVVIHTTKLQTVFLNVFSLARVFQKLFLVN